MLLFIVFLAVTLQRLANYIIWLSYLHRASYQLHGKIGSILVSYCTPPFRSQLQKLDASPSGLFKITSSLGLTMFGWPSLVSPSVTVVTKIIRIPADSPYAPV